MQDPFDEGRNTSGGMKLGTFLLLLVLVVAGMVALANLDLDVTPMIPEVSPSASPSQN